MEDLSLDVDSPHNAPKGDDKHAPKTPKKKQKKEKDIDAASTTKEDTKKQKEKKKSKKDKKGKDKKRIPTSSSSSALSQTKKGPTIISGSTCVGLSTREFSHNSPFEDDGDASSSSSSSSPSPATRPAAAPLMASSPSSHLSSRASRGSMPQFASSPELLDLSSVRSRPKSSIIAGSSGPAVSPPTPATAKLSPGKEKNAHTSSGFDTTIKAPSTTSGAATTRSRSGSSECVMEGFLEEALLKRVGSTHTRRVSKWRKRWVRLFRCDAGTFLLTHDKPPAAGKKPTAVRSRIDVLAIVAVEKRDDIRRCAFVLMPDDCDRQPPYYFCADTEGARKSWMAAIARVQQQEVSDIVQPLRSRQQEPAKEKESELRPGMTSLDFDDLAEDKRRKRTMVLVNGEEKKEKAVDIQEEQDQVIDEDSEEARMMRDIERRVQELSAAQHQHHLQPSGFGPSAPVLSMSSVPAYYHPQQQLQFVPQQQQVLLRQQSYSVVGPHHHAPGSTLSGSYNPFVEVPATAAAVPQQHLQPQTSASSYYMQPPVRRGSFVATDLSSSHSALPQAQTVVMSTLSAAAVSPSTSTSISSISPHGTPPAGMPALPSPHIPPPFMRQSSSIHMAAAHHNSHHHLLSSAPSAVAQS